jgi:uncharacterized protein (DUF1501 family)
MTTRREFLKTGLMGTTITLLAPRHVIGAPPRERRRALVILQLAGGNDSLNTLIPWTDARYRKLRPTLAIEERSLIPIDDTFAFHPALAKLAPIFEKGRFALVDGVGFPSLDRSHFRCEDVWQTGDEGCGRDRRPRLGWIGRYADLHLGRGAALTTVAVGNSIPLGMRVKSRRATVIGDPALFALKANSPEDDAQLAALRDLYRIPRHAVHVQNVSAFGSDLFAALDRTARDRLAPGQVQYPESRFGKALQRAAVLLDAHPETEIVWITTGGYDTHAMQAAQHAVLLRDLAGALAAFDEDLARRKLSEHVLVLAWSEFGRRAAENASAGTDHGKAGLVFLLGDSVVGGIHGVPPDFGRLHDGDLPSRVDFRSIYATVIRDWFRQEPEPILGARYPTLQLIRAVSPAGRPAPSPRRG